MAKVKDNLSSELARLANEAEKLEILSTKHEDLEKQYTEIQSDYQTMLTVSIYTNLIELLSSIKTLNFRCMARKRRRPKNCA